MAKNRISLKYIKAKGICNYIHVNTDFAFMFPMVINQKNSFYKSYYFETAKAAQHK